MSIKLFSPKRYFIRDIQAGDLLEHFFVSAIATIFTVRFYLYLFNYPQIGGGPFHIAHILWGGLLMFVAICLLLVTISKSLHNFAALIGGVGFGLFIDELGKLVTSDNDYFFQPTIAILYVFFVIFYISIRTIDRQKKFSEKEYLANAIELIKDAVINDLDQQEKKKALQYLRRCSENDPLVQSLKHLLSEIDTISPPDDTLVTQIKHIARRTYHTFITKRWFARLVLVVFVSYSLYALANALSLLMIARTVPQYIEVFTSIGSGVLVLVGLAQWRRSRTGAYTVFRYALLLAIFIILPFSFYRLQFFALASLFGNILVLVVLEYSINQERVIAKLKDQGRIS